VVGTLLSGIVVWGGIGWLLDHWLDTRAFTPIGVLLGAGLSVYLVVKKFGGLSPTPPTASQKRKPVRQPAESPAEVQAPLGSAPQHDAPRKDE
jgi:F0F1-type ATP synthase assembly protein I